VFALASPVQHCGEGDAIGTPTALRRRRRDWNANGIAAKATRLERQRHCGEGDAIGTTVALRREQRDWNANGIAAKATRLELR
jgi:transposase InsO family protein